MSEWSPVITRIQKIEKHPNADTLSIAIVMDEYPVIVKTGQYQENDLVSYIGYDSIVPDNETFSFLSTNPVGQMTLRQRTIRSKKIRGVYSEGLILPAPPGFQEGDSVVEYFGLTKRIYEEELPEHTDSGNETAPKTFSLFKYDLDGLAKYGYVFQEGEEVVITEKIEGENCAFVYTEDRLWVRSRNWFKKNDPDSRWWDIPRRLNLEEKLKVFPGLVIWGECYGGVKGWKYDCLVVNNKIERKFRVFDIWDIEHKRFLQWHEVEDICQKLELDTVPILYKGPWKTDRSLHELAEGKSTIGECVKEGWTMRSVPEGWHEKLGRKIVKLKGRDYKLAKG